MPKKKRGRSPWPYWSRFLPERSITDRQTRKLFLGSHVAVSIPGPATLREIVIKATHGAKPPFPIASLSDELDTIKLPRGSTYFTYLGNFIDRIARNFPEMRWWISDAGVNIAVVPGKSMLPQFDALAGELCARFWNDGLSTTSLQLIARELDIKGEQIQGTFLDRFEPAARKTIKEFNQKHSRAAIKTFEQAIANPRLVRLVRRRLYRAHDRFLKAQPSGL